MLRKARAQLFGVSVVILAQVVTPKAAEIRVLPNHVNGVALITISGLFEKCDVKNSRIVGFTEWP